MNSATLEHVNITVADPDKTAAMLCDLFGWKIRWRGNAKGNGLSVHVGTEEDYLAIYTPPTSLGPSANSNMMAGGLNHIGVQVDDLDAVEKRVVAAGLSPFNHANYEPGRRFYFLDGDGIEFEVMSYR